MISVICDVPKRHLFEQYEWLPEIEIDGYKIPAGSHLDEKTIRDLQVRKKTGVTIIAIRREQKVYTNPEPEFMFKQGDFIIFTGNGLKTQEALHFFKGTA